MKCPKCGYTSFPHLESCRKCGHGLAEQRAALGIYALRPDPPDLLLAYEAASMDVPGAALSQPLAASGIDLGQLEEIDLELAAAEPSEQETPELGAPAVTTQDSMPTLDREATGEEEFSPVEPSAGQLSSEAMIMPQALDLSALEDITLELEKATDLQGESPESAQTPKESSEAKQVYDLDLDENVDGLTLGTTVDERRADDDDEEVVEYTLEIEEDLEFEVDELELEQDDEAEEEDDDDR